MQILGFFRWCIISEINVWFKYTWKRIILGLFNHIIWELTVLNQVIKKNTINIFIIFFLQFLI